MMAETGAGVRIGSPQYLERIVPVINYYNPISSQIPRTPAQKHTPPKKKKVVRKATTHKAKAKKPTPNRKLSSGATIAGRGITAAGGGAAGAQGYANFGAQAGRDLGNPDATQAEKSLAGSRMAFLRWHPEAADFADLGRSQGLDYAAGGLAVIGTGLEIWSYHEQGAPWWEATVKGVVVSGFAYAGGVIGGSAGFVAGGAAFPLDVTGVPEAVGTVAGSVAGGEVGGRVGAWFVNLF